MSYGLTQKQSCPALTVTENGFSSSKELLKHSWFQQFILNTFIVITCTLTVSEDDPQELSAKAATTKPPSVTAVGSFFCCLGQGGGYRGPEICLWWELTECPSIMIPYFLKHSTMTITFHPLSSALNRAIYICKVQLSPLSQPVSKGSSWMETLLSFRYNATGFSHLDVSWREVWMLNALVVCK